MLSLQHRHLDGGIDGRHLVLFGDDVRVVGVRRVHHVHHRVVVNKVVQFLVSHTQIDKTDTTDRQDRQTDKIETAQNAMRSAGRSATLVFAHIVPGHTGR